MGLQKSWTRLSYWAHTHAHTTIYNECGHPLCQEFSSFSLHSSPLGGWLKYNPGPHPWKLWFKRSGVGLEKVHFWQVTRGCTYCRLWYHTLWELLSCFVLGLLLVGKTKQLFHNWTQEVLTKWAQVWGQTVAGGQDGNWALGMEVKVHVHASHSSLKDPFS